MVTNQDRYYKLNSTTPKIYFFADYNIWVLNKKMCVYLKLKALLLFTLRLTGKYNKNKMFHISISLQYFQVHYLVANFF
jgi:hypothetical protein